MNRRQRDANRATAFMARWALQRSRQSFSGTAGSGSMVILSSRDFTRGTTARPTFVCYDDIESSTALTLADLPADLRSAIFGVREEAPRTIPLLTEGEGDMLRVLDGRWASTTNSLTGDGNAVFERAASGSVWVSASCGIEGKVFEKPTRHERIAPMTHLVLIPTPTTVPTTIDALGPAPSMPDTADGLASAATHRQWSETPLTIYRCERDGSWWWVIEEVAP